MSASTTSEPLLEAILADPVQAAAACRRGDVPASTLRALSEHLETPEVRLFLARCPDTPTRIIEDLCAGLAVTAAERRALATHARTPPGFLAGLVADPDPAVRQAVATNTALAPAVAARLAQDTCWRVRRALAANPALPTRLQRALSADVVPLVRTALLSQSRLEPEVFEMLARDPDPAVRAAAVLDRHTPEAQLLEWADGDDPLLHTLLLRRASLPSSVRESLCFSPHAAVQRQAVAGRDLAPDEWVGWCREGHVELRRDLAGRRDLSPLGAGLLASDPEPAVRAALAANPELPPALAEILVQDPVLEVRLALAGNLAVAARVVLRLLQRDDPETRAIAVTRGDLDADHLALILGSADDTAIHSLALTGSEYPDLPALHAHRLQAHRLPTLRALAAPSRHLTRAMAEALASDPAPEVRYRLCANPALDADLLARLAADPERRVAERAGSRRAPPPRHGQSCGNRGGPGVAPPPASRAIQPSPVRGRRTAPGLDSTP